MQNNIEIGLISEDIVFKSILKRLLNKNLNKYKFAVYSSFSEIKNIKPETKPELIIIDDVISGTAGNELVSYLRNTKEFTCPVIYFSNAEEDAEKKALENGVSFFFNKPFNPVEFGNLLKDIFKNNQN